MWAGGTLNGLSLVGHLFLGFLQVSQFILQPCLVITAVTLPLTIPVLNTLHPRRMRRIHRAVGRAYEIKFCLDRTYFLFRQRTVWMNFLDG